MTHENIQWKILDVFQECKVKSFPVNIFNLIEHYGYECREYSEESQFKKEACHKVSDDAFRLKNKIFYNDTAPFCRRRFSLAHELGHIILEHCSPYSEYMEKEANYFASRLLAPRMAIYYAKCKNATDVSKKFKLTYEAASYAFDDYRRWYRYVIYHKMSQLDKRMYSQFYDIEHKCFIWNIHKCYRCGITLFNQTDDLCEQCKSNKPDLEELRIRNQYYISKARWKINHMPDPIPGFSHTEELNEQFYLKKME